MCVTMWRYLNPAIYTKELRVKKESLEDCHTVCLWSDLLYQHP